MSATKFREQALNMAENAINLENQGDFTAATNEYLRALDYLFAALKYERSEHMKVTLRETMQQYMDKVEDLKALIVQHETTPVNGPFNQGLELTSATANKNDETLLHKSIYNLANQIIWSVFECCQSASSREQVYTKAQRTCAEGLVSLKLVDASIEEVLEHGLPKMIMEGNGGVKRMALVRHFDGAYELDIGISLLVARSAFTSIHNNEIVSEMINWDLLDHYAAVVPYVNLALDVGITKALFDVLRKLFRE
ncbi:hypothetical protein P9112_008076 [Eukaryota sp. TZLM1-RC]